IVPPYKRRIIRPLHNVHLLLWVHIQNPYTIPILTGIHGVGVVLFPVVQSRCLWRVCLSIRPQRVFPYLMAEGVNSQLKSFFQSDVGILSDVVYFHVILDSFNRFFPRHHGWSSFSSSISICSNSGALVAGSIISFTAFS